MKGPGSLLTKGKERMKSAFGKGTPAPVDPAEELAKKKEGFLSAHAMAEKRVGQLRKTPGADRNAKVKDLVAKVGTLSTEIKGEGEKAATVELVDTACKRLSEIYTKANEATVACTGPGNLSEFEKSREKARGTLGEIRNLPGATIAPFLIATITGTDGLIDKATTAARDAVNKEEVKTQIDALKAVSKARDEAKRASENYLKAAPKNLGDFEKKRKAASDRIEEVRSLRGATDDPTTADFLKKAEDLLKDATTKAREVKTSDEVGVGKVDEQIKRLPGVETFLKQAETASKEAKQRAKGDAKALPKFNDMLAQAEKARDALMDIGVAKDEYIALTNLIAACRTMAEGAGAGQALKDLSKYTKHVADAEKKKQDLKSKVSPQEVTKAVEKLKPLLTQMETLAPEYLAKMHGDSRDVLIMLGHTDAAKAVTDLDALAVTVQGDLDTLQTQKADAEKKAAAFGTQKDGLVNAGYREEFFSVAAQLGKLANDLDIPARDWGRAVERLDNAISLIGEVKAAQEKSKAEWDKNDGKRKEMRAYATKLLSWPPLQKQAARLLANLNEVEEQFKNTGDYAACQELYLSMDFDDAETTLKDGVQANPDMPPLDKLAEFRKAFTDANGKFNEAFANAETRLMLVGRKMKDMADPAGSKLYHDLYKVRDEWEAIMANPAKDAEPAKLVVPFITRANEIKDSASELLNDPKKLADYEKESKLFEARNPDGKLPKMISGMIDELERAGIALPNHRKTLKDLADPTLTPEARGDGLLKLQGELKDLVAANKRLETDRISQTKEAVEIAVKEPLKRIKGRHREFQDYQKDLETQAEDIEAMTETDDPYFLKTARLETVTLAKKVVAVDPKQRGDQGARYKAVEERWATLRKGLAGDMKDFLPDTHKKLRTDLATQIGKSRKLPPAEALKVFDEIEPRIQTAVDRLPAIRVEKEKYKKRRERVEKQWAQVKKDTKTRITDRATEFASALEARLGEADGALKEENGFRRANALLKGLEDKLQSIQVSGDPRAALQKMDADAAQEQRVIRDMAREFEEEIKFYKEKTIPRARQAVKERTAARKSLLERAGDKLKGLASKATETKIGGTDLDEELLDSLESTAKTAPKLVQSYLNMVSTTKIGAAKAPQLSTAKAAFQSARGMLASATRSVDALKVSAGGNDMTVTQDLKKVQANWVAQTQNYSKVVHAIAAAIRQAAQDDPDEEVKAAAAKAAKTVSDAAGAFHATAFQADFDQIEKKDATSDAKLAAREKALTTMRAYRKLLLNHPVHKSLTGSEDVFADESTMRGAARGILVGLKRIELETLVN